ERAGGKRAGRAPPAGAGHRRKPAREEQPGGAGARQGPAPHRLPPPLLRPRRRAHPRARLPTPRAGRLALRRRRAQAEDQERRAGDRLLERHLGRATSPNRPRPRARRGPHRRGSRRRPPCDGGGERLMHEPWWITIIKALIVINVVMLFFAFTT